MRRCFEALDAHLQICESLFEGANAAPATSARPRFSVIAMKGDIPPNGLAITSLAPLDATISY